MIVRIEQVVGEKDKTPNKEALLTKRNIELALNAIYPDEKFIVTTIKECEADEEWDKYTENIGDDIDSLGEFAGTTMMSKRNFDEMIAGGKFLSA